MSCSGWPGFGYDLAMSPASELLARLARLHVDRSNGQRKPHKPLLSLPQMLPLSLLPHKLPLLLPRLLLLQSVSVSTSLLPTQ